MDCKVFPLQDQPSCSMPDMNIYPVGPLAYV